MQVQSYADTGRRIGPLVQQNARAPATAGLEDLQTNWRSQLAVSGGPGSGVGEPDPNGLTDRECSVLQLLSQGFSNKEAARRLGISPETVKSHVKNIFLKLAVDRRAQAVSRAMGLGVITAG